MRSHRRLGASRSSGDRTNGPRWDRVTMLSGFFFVFAAFIILRQFNLQILNHGFYAALASGQHDLVQKLFPKRGMIYVTDRTSPERRYVIASNRELDMVYADPRLVTDPKAEAEALAPILGMKTEELEQRLSNKEDRYEPLKHKLSEKEAEDIRTLNLSGIKTSKETWRFYPEGETMADLTGFVGFVENDRQGRYGLEGFFEQSLAGSEGVIESERAAGGQWITIGNMKIQEAVAGDDLVTTIDRNIQFFACKTLKEHVERHGAEKGMVIIMDPHRGTIQAMCSMPSYDPNYYSQVERPELFNNDAIFDQYEPGSVFKIFAIAAALDAGKITPRTPHNDTGAVQIGKYTIRNSDGKAHGLVDFNTVLAESLNTGSIAAVRTIGDKAWRDAVQRLGFGEKTGIELIGEQTGDISSLDELKEIYSATSSFGQGITVTALQMISATAAIANGGYLVTPTIIDRQIKANGFEIKKTPEIRRQVLSSKTATVLGAMLVNVVDNGHAKRAGIPGYYVAGKTGTGQIPKENGPGYEEHAHKDTFVGFAPVDDPDFVMLTFIDRPKDVQWAEGSAVPLFGEIAKFLLDYDHIPPTRS